MSTTLLISSVVFGIGLLYLALHLGPLLRLWFEPSIRGGTRWRFFTSEVLLFLGWWAAFPENAHSPLWQAAIGAHLVTHAIFALLDLFAHDWLLRFALSPRSRPGRWLIKEGGLLFDTATHATVVALAAPQLPPAMWAGSGLLALAGYMAVTRTYTRAYARALELR